MGKKGIFFKAFFALIFLSGVLTVDGQDKGAQTNKQRGFTENKGQIFDQNHLPNPSVKYLATFGNGLNVQLNSNGFSYDTYSVDRKIIKRENSTPSILQTPIEELTYNYHRIDIELVGANQNAIIVAEDPSTEFANYYNAITPEKGVCGVKTYGKITYLDIYPGIDLEFYVKDGGEKLVEYNFIIHKNADISQIQLRYSGANSAQIVDSKIVLETSNGKLSENIPASWIKETHQKQDVRYRFISNFNNCLTVGFEITDKNANNGTLIIDPTPAIDWATYIGGTGNDIAFGLATDLMGNTYVTGRTQGDVSMATAGAHQVALGGSWDAFYSMYNSAGVKLYSTYFGGANNDMGCKIALDAYLGLYVVGKTQSANAIATTGAQLTTLIGGGAIFLAKFNATSGMRDWGTYYGGGASDGDVGDVDNVPSIAVCPINPISVYISGKTNSTTPSNIATVDALQTSLNGDNDVCIARYNSSGVLQWGTFYGGANFDSGMEMAMDGSKNVIISGLSNSTTGFATSGSHQVAMGGSFDAFVMKIDSNNVLKWCTYYGGTGFDRGDGVAVDLNGNIFLTGLAESSTGAEISTGGSHQVTNGGGIDAILVKFNSNGVRQWGTYYGGSGVDIGKDVTVTCGNDLIICGETQSSTSISTTGSYDPTFNGGKDVLLARFNNNGVRQWGTYHGGSQNDFAWDVAITPLNKIVICGETKSSSLIATPNAADTIYGANGQTDGFVAQFNEIDISGITTVCENTPLSLLGLISTTASPVLYSWSGPGGVTSLNDTLIVPNAPLTAAGLYTVTITANGCVYTATSDTVKINPMPTPMANVVSPICVNDSVKLTASGGVSYSWSGPNGFISSAQNPNIATSVMASAGIYVVTVTNSLGCTATAQDTLVVNARPAASASSNSPICEYQTINLGSSPNSQISYSWTGPLSYVSSLQNPIINNAAINKGGNYSVTITNSFGCTATAQTTVVVNPNPIAGASSNSPVCEKGTINLTSTPNGQSSYVWSGPQSYGSSVQNPLITNVATNMSGNYSVIVTNSFGCNDTAQIIVIVNANPLVTASSNSPICEDDTLKLFSGPNSQTSYAWSGPVSYSTTLQNPTIAHAGIPQSGNYIVTVTNSNGCTAIEQTSVVVNPVPIITAISNSPVCEGDTLKLFSTGGTDCSWIGVGGFVSTEPNPILANSHPSMSGLYTVVITNGFGCATSLPVNALVNPKPIAQISSSPAICSGYPLNLYSDGGTSYAWTGPNSFSSNLQNPVIDPVVYADSGLYRVIVTNGFACKDTASLNVVVHDNPIPTISSNSPLCAYDSIQLNAGGGVGYNWSGVASYLSSSQNPIIHTMDSTLSGIYTVVVTNQYGCTTSTSTTVEVKTNPKPLLATNAPVCAGDTLRLFSSSGQTYAWHGPMGYANISQNLVLSSPSVSQGGYYKQIISYSNGCSNDDSLLVVVRTNPVIAINSDTTICLHQEIEVVASGVATYAWNNGITTPSFLIFPSVDTTYQVTGVDLNGCRDTASFDVNVLPFVEVSLVQNPSGTLFKDQIASYSALPSGFGNYSFYVNYNLVQNSSSNMYTTANISDGDSVMVIVSNSNMCFSSPELGVKVIEIYNSFSPNDDGVNDLFLQGYQITVFNRWGDVMYQGVDGWNGKYNGEDVNTGTYYFTIKYSTADDQEIEYKGDLMLVR